MALTAKRIAISWGFVLAAGTLLWPPGAVYWEWVAAVIGDGPTLVMVGVIAIGLGVVFAWTTATGVTCLAVGGVIAYITGMVAIEVVRSPNSPVHFVLYAGLFACLLCGGLLGFVLSDGDDSLVTTAGN